MQKKIKICQFCGVEYTYKKFLEPLCFKLVENEYEVTAVFSRPGKNNISFQKGIKFKNIFFKRRPSIFSNIRTIIELYIYFRKEKFDIVEIHTPLASIPGRIAAKLAKIKTVIYKVHGYYFHENMNFILRLFHISLEYFLSKLTDYIFTVSYEDAIFAKVAGFKKNSKIFYLGNGVDNRLFYPPSYQEIKKTKIKYGISKDLFVIGIVSRQVVEKGLRELFEAFDLIASNNKKVALLICGSKLKSDYAQGVEKELSILKSKFKNRIFELGQIEQVNEIYRIMDLFCLPSYREGLPYTILEAMMTGVSVVASDIRGNREVVIDNKTGLLCSPKDVISLKISLEELIKDNSKRKLYSEKALKNVLQNHNLEDVLEKEINLLKQIKNVKMPKL